MELPIMKFKTKDVSNIIQKDTNAKDNLVMILLLEKY